MNIKHIKIKRFIHWFLSQSITVFSCVLIITLGISAIGYAFSDEITSIRDNYITTQNLNVLNDLVTKNLSVTGNVSGISGIAGSAGSDVIGNYSAIVYKDGDLAVAKDNVGVIIKQDTNATTVIQAAIDHFSGNKIITIQDDFIIPSKIVLSDNTTLILNGKLTAAPGFPHKYAVDFAMIENDFANGNENITIIGNKEIDANNQPIGSICLMKVNNLNVPNAYIKGNNKAWGFRMTQCDNIRIGTIYVDNYAGGWWSDGVHLMECTNATIDAVLGQSGDDLFAINAGLQESEQQWCAPRLYSRNISVGRVVGKTSDGTGCRLGQTLHSVAANETVDIRNVHINSIIIDSDWRGIDLTNYYSKSTFENIVIDSLIVRNTRDYGVHLDLPIKQFHLNALIEKTRNTPFRMDTATKYGSIKLNISDVPSGAFAAQLYGDHMDFDININYVRSGKTPSHGIVGYVVTNSVFDVNITGCHAGFVLKSGSSNNLVRGLIHDCDYIAVADSSSNGYNTYDNVKVVDCKGSYRLHATSDWRM